MPVNLISSSGGTTTLTPAASASNFTITLPAATGTVLTTTSPKAGNVLQVVSAVYSTRQSFSVTSGAYSDTGLTASITPSSASNKILVMVTATHQSDYRGQSNIGSALGLKRNSTRIAGYVGDHVATIGNAENLAPTGNIIMLDSPASTSSVTYTAQITAVGGSQTVWFNGTYGQAGFDSYITLMEIAG